MPRVVSKTSGDRVPRDAVFSLESEYRYHESQPPLSKATFPRATKLKEIASHARRLERSTFEPSRWPGIRDLLTGEEPGGVVAWNVLPDAATAIRVTRRKHESKPEALVQLQKLATAARSYAEGRLQQAKFASQTVRVTRQQIRGVTDGWLSYATSDEAGWIEVERLQRELSRVLEIPWLPRDYLIKIAPPLEDDSDGGLDMPQPLATALSPAIEKAWASYRRAFNDGSVELQRDTEDAVWEWLKENDPDHEYRLPKRETWKRQIREARKSMGIQKMGKRTPPPPEGRSFVKCDKA